MALLDRLRVLLSRERASKRQESDIPAPVSRLDSGPREQELRQRLAQDPNDVAAFRELARIVDQRAEGVEPLDPLTAESLPEEAGASADVAVWALAEELAGSPKGWYPLIALGRLSLDDDHEGAMRRFHSACQRETTGRALAEGVATLRRAHLPGDGLSLGVGHWSPQEHIPEAGREIVLAAVEADRALDARRHLDELATRSGESEVAAMIGELEPQVAAAEA